LNTRSLAIPRLIIPKELHHARQLNSHNRRNSPQVYYQTASWTDPLGDIISYDSVRKPSKSVMSDAMHLFEFQATSGAVEYSDELRRWAYGSGLQLGAGDIVRYVGKGAHGTDVGAMQTLEPMRSSCHVHYYELQILREGKTGRVSVGFAESGFKLNRHCG